MQITNKRLDELKPYENNPRKNDKSVDYVAIKSDSERIDHYEIMRDGRMRVVKRNGNSYFAKPRKHTNGYLRYQLERKDFYIHRLVATHFCENPNNYNEVNHIDGNKENNSADNLEWCNRSMNNKHAFQAGLRDYAELSKMSSCKKAIDAKKKRRKLTDEQVREVRELLKSGKTTRDIAKIYNCSHGVIDNIKYGLAYKEVV